MQQEASLSLEEQLAIKNVLLAFITRVADKDCQKKSGEEVAILPQIIEITTRLFHPFPVKT